MKTRSIPEIDRRGFVKFFGQGSDRSPRDRAVLDAVATSGSHRICTYPRGRRPRAVRDGDVMFIGQLVKGPNDIVVYGRAVALAYEGGRDDADGEDIAPAALAGAVAALHPCS